MIASRFYEKPSKKELVEEYKGKNVWDLPTPSLIIDREKFEKNATRMLESTAKLGADLRCHIKTHKTVEGVGLQLGVGGNNPHNLRTSKIVVSTLQEAWAMVPLINAECVDDVLFGLPVTKLKLAEVHVLSKMVTVRLMVDSADQVKALCEYAAQNDVQWDVFIKVDAGTGRAGVLEHSLDFDGLVSEVLESRRYVSLYGVYCHAGHSYGAKSPAEAEEILIAEVRHANNAAAKVLEKDPLARLQLSVGATPTAHAFENLQSLDDVKRAVGGTLHGQLELHAGNYPCCDLQQVATGLVEESDVSMFLLAEVLSSYPGRGGHGPGEQLINAGAIALSRELGPYPGHGKIVRPEGYGEWVVGKVSQEHGILHPRGECTFFPYGEKVLVLPQHACITACAHAWYFVVEKDVVVDVWVPAKLW